MKNKKRKTEDITLFPKETHKALKELGRLNVSKYYLLDDRDYGFKEVWHAIDFEVDLSDQWCDNGHDDYLPPKFVASAKRWLKKWKELADSYKWVGE